MILQEQREQVLEVALSMLRDGVAHGSQGNVSCMARDKGMIAITPSAIPYGKLKPEDISVVDLEGAVLEGAWKPTSEIALHLVFYRNRPDVNAVVHSHAPYCSVFGITNQSLPSVLTEAGAALGGPVPVAQYRSPGTQDVAQICYEVMGDGVAVIMAHHGLVTVGATLGQAYDATMAAETTARLVILARSIGAKEISLDPLENAVMRSIYLLHYHPTALKK